MCLAVPGKVVDIKDDNAIIDYGGIRKSASILLMPDIKIGEIVMVHVGFVIARLNPDEAEETIGIFKKIGEAKI